MTACRKHDPVHLHNEQGPLATPTLCAARPKLVECINFQGLRSEAVHAVAAFARARPNCTCLQYGQCVLHRRTVPNVHRLRLLATAFPPFFLLSVLITFTPHFSAFSIAPHFGTAKFIRSYVTLSPLCCTPLPTVIVFPTSLKNACVASVNGGRAVMWSLLLASL